MAKLSTRNLTPELKDIPPEWIFNFYLNIKESLTGQSVKVQSVFNPADETPSMFVYFDNKQTFKYRYKCFSTGKSGDPIQLVVDMYSLKSRLDAVNRIMLDYAEYITRNGDVSAEYAEREASFKNHDRWKVTHFETRKWNTKDVKFWQQFDIGSKTLEKYNVKPLSVFHMEKVEDEQLKQIVKEGEYFYGYFRIDGSLYKIYQPYIKKKKFIKVAEYIQGMDQLTFKKKYLVITKSLKDIMCLSRMNLPCEFIAPDSENTMIRPNVIESFFHKYDGVCTMFDNDKPGHEAMQKYQDMYDLPAVYYDILKDPSDGVKEYGLIKIRERVHKLLADTLIYGNFKKPELKPF
jgi:hypothetical protein